MENHLNRYSGIIGGRYRQREPDFINNYDILPCRRDQRKGYREERGAGYREPARHSLAGLGNQNWLLVNLSIRAETFRTALVRPGLPNA